MRAEQRSDVPKSARLAQLLGLLSMASFFLAVMLGFLIADLGMSTLFLSLVLPLSIATVAFAAGVRRDLGDANAPGYRQAAIGFAMGLSVLALVGILVIGVMIILTLVLRG